jgi:hypothetical protein
MRTQELFGLFVRATGFLIIVYGLWNILGGLESIPESLLDRLSGGDHTDEVSIFSYFAFGIPTVAFGVFCFFCADWVARLAYREK